MSSGAVRTAADGTEHPDTITTEVHYKKAPKKPSIDADKIDKLGKDYLAKQTTSSILYDPTNSENQSFNYPPAVLPKGKRFYLIPRLVKQSEDSRRSLKNRKLNLVLMEPYRVSSDSRTLIIDLHNSFFCRPALIQSSLINTMRTE